LGSHLHTDDQGSRHPWNIPQLSWLSLLRLDGATKIEDRQYITERFNTDVRVFAFIDEKKEKKGRACFGFGHNSGRGDKKVKDVESGSGKRPIVLYRFTMG
jgi:hypothetical protein